jgi:hypothetical protein
MTQRQPKTDKIHENAFVPPKLSVQMMSNHLPQLLKMQRQPGRQGRRQQLGKEKTLGRQKQAPTRPTELISPIFQI